MCGPARAASLHHGKPEGQHNGHGPDEDTLRVHSSLMEVAEREPRMSGQPCFARLMYAYLKSGFKAMA
jgi:hypothetical protein